MPERCHLAATFTSWRELERNLKVCQLKRDPSRFWLKRKPKHTHVHVTHTHTHTTLSSDTLYCDCKTRFCFSVDVNALLSYLHVCLTWSIRPWVPFHQWFEQTLISRPTKGTVVPNGLLWTAVQRWYLLWSHQCLPCPILIVFFCDAFLVPKFCPREELSTMPDVMFKASASNVYRQSHYSRLSSHAVCSFHFVSVVV